MQLSLRASSPWTAQQRRKAGPAARSAAAACRRPARVCAARASFDIDNSSVLVAGDGGVALDVTRKLKDLGAWVWQLQPTDIHRKEIEGMMAIVVVGDASKRDDVDKAFSAIDGVDAVVSIMGGAADPAPDSQGSINLMDAAARHGVKKFVLVAADKDAAEEHLKDLAGDLDVVVVPWADGVADLAVKTLLA